MMDNLKPLVIVPFCLLAACAPHRPVMEQPLDRTAPLSLRAETPIGVTPKSTEKVTPETKKLTEQQKAATRTISSWEVRGALAAKNRAKGWSAAMNWIQHGPSSYQIRLMGPLGAGTVLISKKGNTITFQDGPKIITSHSADNLLLEQTGIRLPVSNLYYWIRGLAAPGKVSGEQHDALNRLVQLRQSGYVIDFGNYTTVKGATLPGLVRLVGNGVMVKVVLKNWNI